jgi:hypothetical protein
LQRQQQVVRDVIRSGELLSSTSSVSRRALCPTRPNHESADAAARTTVHSYALRRRAARRDRPVMSRAERDSTSTERSAGRFSFHRPQSGWARSSFGLTYTRLGNSSHPCNARSVARTLQAAMDSLERHLLPTLAMFVPLGIADVLFMRLLRVPWDMRWPVLHATANMVITAVSAPDAWRALSDPRAACGGEFTRAPLYMVFAVSATRPHRHYALPGAPVGTPARIIARSIPAGVGLRSYTCITSYCSRRSQRTTGARKARPARPNPVRRPHHHPLAHHTHPSLLSRMCVRIRI